jgi:hypothetical protein
MKKYLAPVVAALVALLLLPAPPASAVVGGAPDGGEHPFVGQLLFFVPNAIDSRFDDPGAWFTCSGTLIDADTVVTAGHCTFDVGVEGVAPKDPLFGGTDVWFSVSEEPDFAILDPSTDFVPDRNAERYQQWSTALDASSDWAETESTFTHPEFEDATFFEHDLGVLELSEPIELDEYGTLPSLDYLDQYAGKAKQQARFESVGYGLEASGPFTAVGGDTRRKAQQRLVSFKGAFGLRDVAVMFSHAKGGSTDGGTCFGDSGGPTFDVSTPALEAQNLFVTVTSFGFSPTCTAGGYYRLDQPDDIAFLADPAGAFS